ncbi:MAG: hypothetical protein J6B01_00125 [Ruminococcus sp.]|nr:hypothetical protein [Ruminococcus sp.]
MEKELTEKLHDLVVNEDGLLVTLRCENYFDDKKYIEIKNILKKLVPLWKANNCVSISGLLSVVNLIEYIAGGNRYLSDEDSIKLEDACIEIMDILGELYKSLDY